MVCVLSGDIVPGYVCALYADDNDDLANIVYADAIDGIGKCLGPKLTGRENANAEVTEHKFTRADGGPSVRLRSEIGSANGNTVQLWVEPAGE